MPKGSYSWRRDSILHSTPQPGINSFSYRLDPAIGQTQQNVIHKGKLPGAQNKVEKCRDWIRG